MQQILEELLRKKGIGPEGSKSLKQEELVRLDELMKSPDVSMTTKATLLTALLTLEPTEAERAWLDHLRAEYHHILPPELHGFIQLPEEPFLSVIRKVIDRQELTEEECFYCMTQVFDDHAPEYLKASFLEGERLKRESFTENKAFFDFMYARCARVQVSIDPLIDICDNYDGSNRSHNFSLFTASLLAAAGYRVVLHGIDSVAPKQGFTSHQILKEAGKNPLITLDVAVANLNDPDTGWAYVDQAVFYPSLYRLKPMRKEMVKRPFLATFEKLLQPIRSDKGNYIVTGYTHPHYKQEVVNQLKHQKQCAKAIVMKGVEGSTHMSLSKDTACMVFDGKELVETTLNPATYGLPSIEQKQDRDLTAADSYREGLKALQGEKNYARENILYQALVIVQKFNLPLSGDPQRVLTTLLDQGKAMGHWNKGNR